MHSKRFRGWAWRGFGALTVLIFFACGDDDLEDEQQHHNASVQDAGTGASDANAQPNVDASADLLPAECALGDPFERPECGAALARLCHSYESEQECTGRGRFIFKEQYSYLCAWSKVYSVIDPVACIIGGSFYRCEAAFFALTSCEEACDLPPDELFTNNSLTARSAQNELVDLPCLAGTALAGPIDEGSAFVNQQGSTRASYNCSSDFPPPPPLCACVAQACASE